MALKWRHRAGDRLYEVRTAGASVRLYTNGVFHSQFNPNRPMAGSVWDLLLLPSFILPGGPRRVLLLGVGGGAVARMLHHFHPGVEVVGVEIDPVHIQVAQRFFGVRGRWVRLEQADAVEWLTQREEAGFDLIIDDLFSDIGGEPERAVPFTSRWIKGLLSRLEPGGVVVANFASLASLRDCGFYTNRRLRGELRAAAALSLPLYDNVIGAFATAKTGSGGSEFAVGGEVYRRLKGEGGDYRLRNLGRELGLSR